MFEALRDRGVSRGVLHGLGGKGVSNGESRGFLKLGEVLVLRP